MVMVVKMKSKQSEEYFMYNLTDSNQEDYGVIIIDKKTSTDEIKDIFDGIIDAIETERGED